MVGLFRRLFARSNNEVITESADLERSVFDTGGKQGRREPPVELDWSDVEYIPMPPSPPAWEVDGRDELQREHEDPEIGPVFQAGYKNQHTKVVKLAACLSAEQRQGRVGEVIVKACRKLVMQRVKASQLAAAAKQSEEMFRLVPGYVQDVDKRRFNRILKDMEGAGKKHSHKPLDASSPSSQALFTVTEGAGWSVVEERRLQGEERPDPAFRIAAVDEGGTWLLDGSRWINEQEGVKGVLRRLNLVLQRRIERNRAGGLLLQLRSLCCQRLVSAYCQPQKPHISSLSIPTDVVILGGCHMGDIPLGHDAYHVAGGFGRCGISIMDSDGRLHIYDESLNLVMETDLRDDSRVMDHFRTIDTNYWGEFRSQVRAVDVAPEGDRYLFTLADEAWCCAISGNTVWGVAMPVKEGWKRVVVRSERFGVGREVEEALRLFGLSLPVEPAEIKRKYRQLASITTSVGIERLLMCGF